MTKLADIPQNSKIYGLESLNGQPVVVIFKHLDGMYSYCHLEDEPEKIVHLSAVTPLKKIDGGYQIIEGGK